jgi:hypothetical protein
MSSSKPRDRDWLSNILRQITSTYILYIRCRIDIIV